MGTGWDVKRNAEGEYECRHGERRRALIAPPTKRGRPWLVYRINHDRRGVELGLGGADSFRSFAAAKVFVTENPGVWGV